MKTARATRSGAAAFTNAAPCFPNARVRAKYNATSALRAMTPPPAATRPGGPVVANAGLAHNANNKAQPT